MNGSRGRFMADTGPLSVKKIMFKEDQILTLGLERCKKNKEERLMRLYFTSAVIYLIVAFGFLGCSDGGGQINSSSEIKISGTPQPSSTNQVNSIEDVRQLADGTWTYTGQEYIAFGQNLWEKWVIKPDGTMEVYLA